MKKIKKDCKNLEIAAMKYIEGYERRTENIPQSVARYSYDGKEQVI